MRKALFTLVILFSFFSAGAQNYQCLQAGVKRFFTNSYGYLRGIRIDSVKTYADSTIYYPFHTARGPYSWSTLLDSTGGSWLGKKAIQRSDGTFLSETMWHDTVVIKTQAEMGDTWIFYMDTTKRFYRANVTAKSVMMVLGVPDTVKKITITAYDDTGLVYADPANNFQLYVSQNHGFCRAFDLYTFPYHAPNAVYASGIDYYLDNLQAYYYPVLPNAGSSIFDLVALVNPSFVQLYDWLPGDAFENSVCVPDVYGECVYPFQYYYDSIVDKNVLSNGVQYTFGGWIATQSFFWPTHVPDFAYSYKMTGNSGSFFVSNELLIDTMLMPEEYGQTQLCHYYANDSSHCHRSPSYQFTQSQVQGNRWGGFFESIPLTKTYKLGIGLLHYNWAATGDPYETSDTTLLFYRKNWLPCGSVTIPPLVPVGIGGDPINSLFRVFPNPASGVIIIKAPQGSQSYTITLVNMLGDVMSSFRSTKNEETVPTGKLPSGLYYLNIMDAGGNIFNEKVVINH